MNEVQTIIAPDGSELVVLPKAEYERLLAAAEEAEALAAYDRVRTALETGADELVPDTVAEQLLAGDNPIAVWRRYRGLTQAALAERAGVAQSVVSAVETGRRSPTLPTLRALAAALDLGLEDLDPAS